MESQGTDLGLSKAELVDHINDLTDIAVTTSIAIGTGATLSATAKAPTTAIKTGTLVAGSIATAATAGAIKVAGKVTANSISKAPESLTDNNRAPSPSDFEGPNSILEYFKFYTTSSASCL